MNKKKLFLFSVALNLVFFVLIAAGFYWQQRRTQYYELGQYYERVAGLIDGRMSQNQQIYNRWLPTLEKILKLPRPAQELFFEGQHIDYIGRWENKQWVALGPSSSLPPFPAQTLQENKKFLFFQKKGQLHFTHTLRAENGATYLVVQKESAALFHQWGAMAQAYIMVIEQENQHKPLTLFSGLNEKQTQAFIAEHPLNSAPKGMIALEDQSFYVTSQILFENENYRQLIVYAFTQENFLLTATYGVYCLLVALFCVSCGLLYWSYWHSQQED